MNPYFKTIDDKLLDLFQEWKRLCPEAPINEFGEFLSEYVFPFVDEALEKKLQEDKK